MNRKASRREKQSSSRSQTARIKSGDAVVITYSWSSDVGVGAVGHVANEMPGGYAVELQGLFTDARGRREFEKRCLFFSHTQLKKIPDAR